MTFKIDKAGFYKTKSGHVTEITGQASQGQWWRLDGKGYHDDGRRIDRDYENEDIIAHWEEPFELEEFAHETDCVSKNKFYAVTSNASNTGILFTYDTLEQAQKGAKSLALNEPDIKFYVLETIAAYTAEVEIKEIKI